MTIESSGTLGLNGTCTGGSSARNQIGAEVSKTAGTALCMNNSCLRTLSGTSSGTSISFSTFYGKSNSFTYTVSSNQTNFCMRAGAVSAGWNGSSKLNVTINSGVIISANSTGVFAMTIQGSYPNGVTVKNNGTVVGMGGAGGGGACHYNSGCLPPVSGSAAGTALKISSAVTICNASGIIAGGGGGGGGSNFACSGTCCSPQIGGSGGGGGRSSYVANSAGGAYGRGCRGFGPSGHAGNPGTYSAAGTGGSYYTGTGGTGGTWGAAGASGSSTYAGAGAAGGAGGKATCGASLVTWTATGTRYGSIS